ncbi:AraC family transcriptional regulator [Puia sp.]|uniref:AraC family transcriptional regulator n=1 Tax=Puia sp. TaxID=2045100 RepID=UPI002F40F275
MGSETYIPSDLLKPYIRSFAIQSTAVETTYKVLPDTGLVMGFQYKGKLLRVDDDTTIALSVSGVSGLADHCRTFRSIANTGTILVFFKEAGATPFFRQPLHELFRDSVSLENFMLRSELLCLEEQFAEASTNAIRISHLENFLIGRMTPTGPDRLVLAALALIHKHKGDIRIKDLARQLHISQSPLEKRFRQAVGATPKKFASIVRLKNVLQRFDPQSSLTELGYEAGFYDQAHFIKEFKAFTGATPEDFFGKK